MTLHTGENRLEELYKFNINGHFYFDGMDFQLQSGDRIALFRLLPVDDKSLILIQGNSYQTEGGEPVG